MVRNRNMLADGRNDGKNYVQSLIPTSGWTVASIREFCETTKEAYDKAHVEEDDYSQGYAQGVQFETNEVILPLMNVLNEDGRSVARPLGDGYTWNGMRHVRIVNNSTQPTAEEIKEATSWEVHITISLQEAQKLAEANLCRQPEHRQTASDIARGVFMEAEMGISDSRDEEDWGDAYTRDTFDPGPCVEMMD